MFEQELRILLKKETGWEIIPELPPHEKFGDIAFPCFELAKKLKKQPTQLAAELAKSLASKIPPFVEKVVANGPYVNFFLKTSSIAEKVLTEISSKKDSYGSRQIGKGAVVVIDYSSPNIGKPFHFGHLRSTVIGNSIANIHEFFGYNVIRINHLGDWGTQFGALIAAHLRWGDKERLKKEPMKYLLDLYVRFNREAEKNPKLQEEAREWFKKLEQGNRQAISLWSKFKHLSLDEFNKIYEMMGIAFDSYDGESFYRDKVDGTISKIEGRGLTQLSEGALVVALGKEIPPCILRKSDEASTYASRDLAAIEYRLKTYSPEKILYVTGAEQQLHFKQVFSVAEKMGWDSGKLVHIPFGFYLAPSGGKMATRRGEAVLLEKVLRETIAKVAAVIEKKNPALKEKAEIARIVGIGAIFFGDLVNDRIKDIVFDWDKIIDFEGDTGPYLQYTHARACSILKKAAEQKLNQSANIDFSMLSERVEKKLLKLLASFGSKAEESLVHYKPHIIAQYLLELGRTFNEFYHSCPCLQEKNANRRAARLLLVDCSRQVLKNGLRLLGIAAPQEM
ncbi:MAG: arginine--tRNA ligase [Candidatus Woesearchaeota archaeon]